MSISTAPHSRSRGWLTFISPNATTYASAFIAVVALTSLVACGGGAPSTEEANTNDSNAVLVKVDQDPTISFTVWWNVGSQNDPVGKEGLAMLTGQMLSQGGTTANPYPAILEKLYPIASNYGVRVDKEMTTLSGRTHKDNVDKFFGLYSDAYLKPAFDPADFERLRSVQKNYVENALRFADDETLAKSALTHAVFEGTRYAHPIPGTLAGLDSITLEDVKAFYAANYTADNATVALGGGFDDGLVERFEATLGQLPGASAEPPESPGVAEPASSEPATNVADVTIDPDPIEGRQVLIVDKPNADASISFGHPIAVKRGEKEFYALWLANSWMGEHRNTMSNLFQVIREKRGLNYGNYSYIEVFPEGGRRQMPPANVARHHQLFEGWIRTLPNEQAIFALRAALREIDRLVNEGMTQEQFDLTRSFLSTYNLHFAPTTQARLGYRVDDAFYGIEGDGHLAQFGTMLDSLTLDDVNAAIKKYMTTDNLQIAIVTGDAAGMKAALESGDPTPITYPTEKSAEIMEEDKQIIGYPLNIAAVETVAVKDIFGK